MAMKLHDWQNSYNSRKILATAFECDISIEPVAIDIKNQSKTPEFLAMNPNGKVPVLTDGGFTLWESNAIMCYVAAKDPARRLLPTDLAQRARIDQWLFWQTAHLSPSIGKVSYERYWKTKMNLGTPDEAAVEAAMPEVTRYLTVLDTQLAKTQWVAGSDLSVADFACAVTFMMRSDIGLNLTAFPNVTKWLSNIEARPSWKNTAW